MSPPQSPQTRTGDSPDPASHAVTIYDPEGEWVDEEEDIDDDDMEYEPTTEDSEDIEFFETEEDDSEFHGAVAIIQAITRPQWEMVLTLTRYVRC